MSTSAKQTDTERRVAQAVRDILGDETDAWVANAGPERLAARLRTGTDTGADEPAASETFAVTLEAWRTSERTVVAESLENLHEWLHALVRDRDAFAERFEAADPAQNRQANIGMRAVHATTIGITAVRATRICKESGGVLAVSPAHTTWASEAQARADARRRRAARNEVTAQTCTEGQRVSVRLGRATAVQFTAGVPAKATASAEQIATMARASANVAGPERWEEAKGATPMIDYVASVRIGEEVFTPPPATRLMRAYVVRVARLREETRTVVVEGPRKDHAPMLEDAVSAAHRRAEWAPSPRASADYDFVDRYRALDSDDPDEWECVPDALRMIDRF